MIRRSNDDLILGRRLRRRPNMKSTLAQRLVFAGVMSSVCRDLRCLRRQATSLFST